MLHIFDFFELTKYIVECFILKNLNTAFNIILLPCMLVSELCKARCFPPIALVWDPPYGLEVYPNLTSQVIVVDSSPATWGSSYGSEHTTILLLVCQQHT